MSFLTPRRLRAYPVLTLIGAGGALLVNVLTRRGWVGGLTGQLMFGDFICYYAAGLIYRTDRFHLYDPAVQEQVQRALVWPSRPPGFAPYISPPYVAAAWGLLAVLPLPMASAFWLLFNGIGFAAAIYILHRWVAPPSLKALGLTPLQLGIIAASPFYVCLYGLYLGQTHILTLLLLSGITAAWLRRKEFLAGLLTGMMLYKPHLATGLLILYLAQRRFQALLGFAIVAGLWVGPSLLGDGLSLYAQYMKVARVLLEAPTRSRDPSWTFITVTPYALLASLIPNAFPVLLRIYPLALSLSAIGMGWVAARLRPNRRTPLISALLYPLWMMPHVLIYDFTVLIPALLLMTHDRPGKEALQLAAGCWIGTFLLPILGYALRIAAPAALTLGLAASHTRHIRTALRGETQCAG
ncbi:MAG: glycosyltransferase family 87 protein [Anaerolineae bacterium]